MVTAILIVFYLLTPALIIYFAGKYLLLKKAGAVLIAYVIGLIVGNLRFIPQSASNIQEILISLSIPLALPLLLMTLRLDNWRNLAKKSLISLVTGVASVIIMVVIAHLIFKNFIVDEWKVSAMLIGNYTGGTPNLAAIKTALNVDANTYMLTFSSDIVVSAAYLLFLMTLGKRFFKKILPTKYSYAGRFNKEEIVFSNFEDYTDFFKKHNIKPTIKAFMVSVIILIIGGGVSMVSPENLKLVSAILIITTLGIASSFIPELRRGPKNFETGMYFILIFSLVVSSQADFRKFTTEALPLFLNVSFVIVFAMLTHATLARIFKLDADTVMITSTALICSPPFVPLIAGSLNNRQVIVSGLTVGLVGYAVGNYLGIMIGYSLKFWF